MTNLKNKQKERWNHEHMNFALALPSQMPVVNGFQV